MHATYYFLTDLDRTLAEGPIWRQAEDRIIDYYSGYCDDNNWWEIEGVTLDDDHWAVREGPLQQTAGCWHRTWVEATCAVACDLKWHLPTTYTAGTLPRMKADMESSRESIAQVICAEIPAFLVWAYSQRPAAQPEAGVSLDCYRRSCIATVYERFLTMSAPDRYPFSDWVCSPYQYRAFDLTGGENANAIVRVDIHT